MMPLWRKLRAATVEVVYPRTCAGCGLRGAWLCEQCEPLVPRLELGICHRCGAPAVRLCQICSHLDPAIVRARSAYPYAGWVRNAVHSFKYAEERDRGADLALRLAPLVRGFGPVDALVPVPLHPARHRHRGYNQAEILARHLGNHLGIPVLPLLERTRETRSQVNLGRDDRRENVRDAFALAADWVAEPGGRFVLIDDVRTTGSTVSACAKTLQRTGPVAIYVATLALDVPDSLLTPWLAEHAPA